MPILNNIKFVVIGVAGIAAAGMLTYSYVRITSLEADNKVKDSQIIEAVNSNKAFYEVFKIEQEKRRKLENDFKILTSKYAANQRNSSNEIHKVDNNDLQKIIKNKPSLLGSTITSSTNRMFRTISSDSQAYYSKEDQEDTTKTESN